jgi:glucan 1,3-beta-glucosidase
VFDPRYRDFPYAPLTGAALPLLFISRWKVRSQSPPAERAMALTLLGSAGYIVLNESLGNWQACWLSAGLCVLASILLRVQDAPG